MPLIRNIDETPRQLVQMDGVEGASMAIMVGRDDGAPNFALRSVLRRPRRPHPSPQPRLRARGLHRRRHRHHPPRGRRTPHQKGRCHLRPRRRGTPVPSRRRPTLQFLCIVPVERNCGEPNARQLILHRVPAAAFAAFPNRDGRRTRRKENAMSGRTDRTGAHAPYGLIGLYASSPWPASASPSIVACSTPTTAPLPHRGLGAVRRPRSPPPSPSSPAGEGSSAPGPASSPSRWPSQDLAEEQALSDDARRVLNRRRERELLCRAIEEDIAAERLGRRHRPRQRTRRTLRLPRRSRGVPPTHRRVTPRARSVESRVERRLIRNLDRLILQPASGKRHPPRPPASRASTPSPPHRGPPPPRQQVPANATRPTSNAASSTPAKTTRADEAYDPPQGTRPVPHRSRGGALRMELARGVIGKATREPRRPVQARLPGQGLDGALQRSRRTHHPRVPQHPDGRGSQSHDRRRPRARSLRTQGSKEHATCPRAARPRASRCVISLIPRRASTARSALGPYAPAFVSPSRPAFPDLSPGCPPHQQHPRSR
jgi:hypothetical protein